MMDTRQHTERIERLAELGDDAARSELVRLNRRAQADEESRAIARLSRLVESGAELKRGCLPGYARRTHVRSVEDFRRLVTLCGSIESIDPEATKWDGGILHYLVLEDDGSVDINWRQHGSTPHLIWSGIARELWTSGGEVADYTPIIDCLRRNVETLVWIASFIVTYTSPSGSVRGDLETPDGFDWGEAHDIESGMMHEIDAAGEECPHYWDAVDWLVELEKDDVRAYLDDGDEWLRDTIANARDDYQPCYLDADELEDAVDQRIAGAIDELWGAIGDEDAEDELDAEELLDVWCGRFDVSSVYDDEDTQALAQRIIDETLDNSI